MIDVLKWILIGLLISLLFGGGAARLKGLFGAVKRLPADFKDGKDQARDPEDHAVKRAKDVNGRVL